jgi:hypothetical protein
MKHSKHEKGQALILIVLAIFGLVGLTGLTIDGGNAYSDRRHAQNAADAAVLAAALAKVRGADWQAAGFARAADNNYDNNGTTNIVQVVSPPIRGTYAGNPDYIQVLITSYVDTYFAGVVGINQMKNNVQAVSKTKLSDIGPLFDGEAMVALSPDDEHALSTCGNPNVDVQNSGIFVNSSSECAMYANGNVSFEVDTAYSVVNSSDPECENGNPSVTGPVVGGAEQIDYPPDIFIAAPTIECAADAPAFTEDDTSVTFYPGKYNFNNMTINTLKNVYFEPGSYCFDGNIKFNGQGPITANYVSFRMDSGDFQINGGSDFTADNFIFYATGDADGIHFNGGGTITTTNTTYYLESGGVEFNGNTQNTLSAPTSGPNANMLIYLPYGNTSGIDITGNSDSTIQGTILGVSSHVRVGGNSDGLALNSQIVGYTVEACGNSFLNISWDPGDNFQQQEPAKIELTE